MKWLELRILPVFVVSIFGVLIWLSSSFFYVVRLSFSYQDIASLVMALLGVGVIVSGVLGFRKQDTTVNPTTPEQASQLVTRGIYRYSRNPMYLGMLLFLMAFAVYLFTLTGWLWVPVFVLYMNKFQIQPEERILERIFGQEYVEYRNKVRRWI